ncbi:hypothetical protein EBR43_01890 [bacterium]|nr:hypothetical protein [bacterium]
MKKVKNLRKDGIVGLFEYAGLDDGYIHFSEWWNGEGFDLDFGNDKRVSLHIDELNALVSICIATNYIDIDDCKENAQQMINESGDREGKIESIKNEFKAQERRNSFSVVKE